jgi:deoxyribodipyrimidine photo-lyase
MPRTDPPSWPATRAEALRRLDDFLPRAGRDYAESRNDDLGPADRSNVSTLSPYLRHRLLTEREVVAATLGRHGPRAAEKFIGETCWRTYWKGWLELRPGVWHAYRAEVRRLLDGLDRDQPLRQAYEAATSGRSGLRCVDLWVEELVETGYLHNHARMWFASLWVFTLGLPWALGADFFLRHLIDGDPASNTLSWRWVAGLQTRGKTYCASAGNIARFTRGRIRPTEPMAVDARPIDGPPDPSWRPLPDARRLAPRRPFALLLTEEDLEPESLDLGERPVGVAGVLATADRSPLPVGELAARFAEGAMADALGRAAGAFGVPTVVLDGDWADAVGSWAAGLGVDQIVTPDAPVGPARERLDRLDADLSLAGTRLARVRRDWDEELWPQATAGYFGFKKGLDASLARLGLFDPRPR